MDIRNKKGQFKKGYTYRHKKLYWDKEWLFEQYIIFNKNTQIIANEQRCGDTNIQYFLKKFGIKTRTTSEIRKKKYWGSSGVNNPMYGRYGELNPNWKGGISPERQAFYQSKEWKIACSFVWKRDNATCQKCSIKKETDIPFHIHHIKGFVDIKLRAEVSNLILLCKNCHWWVHSKKNKQ